MSEGGEADRIPTPFSNKYSYSKPTFMLSWAIVYDMLKQLIVSV